MMLDCDHIYQYFDNSVGVDSVNYKGFVRLAFIDINTSEIFYSIFNVSVHTKNGKKRLKRGKFRVGVNSAFYKFWLSTGLPIPMVRGRPNLSGFADCMGKLKGIDLIGELHADKHDRIIATTIKAIEPVRVESGVLKKHSPTIKQDEWNIDWEKGLEGILTPLDNNGPPKAPQKTTKKLPDSPQNITKFLSQQNTAEAHKKHGTKPNSSACRNDYVKRNKLIVKSNKCSPLSSYSNTKDDFTADDYRRASKGE